MEVNLKVAGVGDLHCQESTPEKRIDDYPETLFNKLNEFIEFSNKNADVVCFPGDTFDTFRASKRLIGRLGAALNKLNKPILAIYGQHDMAHRDNDISNCGIGVLEAHGIIKILNDNPYEIGDVHFYGANFNQPIPKIQDESKFNVLVIHTMIIKSENDKIFFGQKDYQTAGGILSNYSYDLIISGDNHGTLYKTVKNKTLLNPGSVMRNKINQINHKPQYCLFDTDTRKYEIFKFNFKPFNEVFKFEEYKKQKEQNSALQELSNVLKSDQEIEIKFENIVFSSSKNENKNVNKFIMESFKNV